MGKTTIQPSSGNKIPTIINGRIMNGNIKKPSSTTVNSTRVPDKKNYKYEHKVKIIGDSHLRGSAARINQYLNTKFEVNSFIKLGARTNQVIRSQEVELTGLGRKDIIVINGGTNDIAGYSAKRNGITALMTQFTQKYNNTNIIVLCIPFGKGKCLEIAVQAFVEKIQEALDNRLYSVGIFIDLTKAYDTLNHKVLLEKLSFNGIRGITNLWFKSYLTIRRQYLEIRQSDSCKNCLSKFRSPYKEIKLGVPQGSVLGPFCFYYIQMTSP
jgi:hypothetical protein